MRLCDVSLLTFLVSTAKQEDNFIPLLTKINAIALALVNTQFAHAVPHWLDVAKVSEFQTLQPSGDLLLHTLVTQRAQPCREDTCLPDYEHDHMRPAGYRISRALKDVV